MPKPREVLHARLPLNDLFLDEDVATRGFAHQYVQGLAEGPSVVAHQLLRAMAEGNDQARAELIIGDLWLVAAVAQRYRNEGVAYMDLIQTGNIALIEAVDAYHPLQRRGFHAFAKQFIGQAMRYAVVERAHFITLPLDENLGMIEPPISRSKVDEDETLRHDKQVLLALTKNMELSRRERQIITMRYGLHGRTPMTLRAIGEELAVTRDRVRVLQRRAERKLRKDENLQTLLTIDMV